MIRPCPSKYVSEEEGEEGGEEEGEEEKMRGGKKKEHLDHGTLLPLAMVHVCLMYVCMYVYLDGKEGLRHTKQEWARRGIS